ncbi:hypothetical protein LLG10_08170 [bacterium]|nr:hypothetical protein [bacterium]
MYTKEKSPKKFHSKGFVYPYVLLIVCLCLIIVTTSVKQTQLLLLNTDKTIHFQLNRDAQQYIKTILEAKLSEKSWTAFLSWVNENSAINGDLNGDGTFDSFYLLTYFGMNGSAAEIGVCHYLVKPEYWGISVFPITTIPLETNMSKKIKVLPNRFCISPKIGLLYRIMPSTYSISSYKKIAILHNIE